MARKAKVETITKVATNQECANKRQALSQMKRIKWNIDFKNQNQKKFWDTIETNGRPMGYQLKINERPNKTNGNHWKQSRINRKTMQTNRNTLKTTYPMGKQWGRNNRKRDGKH